MFASFLLNGDLLTHGVVLRTFLWRVERHEQLPGHPVPRLPDLTTSTDTTHNPYSSRTSVAVCIGGAISSSRPMAIAF